MRGMKIFSTFAFENCGNSAMVNYKNSNTKSWKRHSYQLWLPWLWLALPQHVVQAAEAVDTVAAPEEVVSQLFPKEIVPLQDTFLIDTSCMEQATCEGMTILKEQGYVMEFAMEGDMARYVFHDKDSETGKKLLEAMQKDSRP